MEAVKKYAVEKRTKWECPEENDARILSMPNIPRPLMGPGCQPRTILGNATWNRLRKRAYFLANYKCEVYGDNLSTPGEAQAHELFSYDFEKGIAKFERCVCLSKDAHIYFIHSGRAITLWKSKNIIYPTSRLLSGAERGFEAIYKWNQGHPDEPKLKAYATFLEYLKHPELAPKMEELIDKYEIEFWEEDKKKYAPWNSWKVVIGSKEYPTPYKDYAAWEEAMKIASKNDTARKAGNPFSGGVFDEIAKLMEN